MPSRPSAHPAVSRHKLLVGDELINCQLLYKQLGTEIGELDKRINQLQQRCRPDLVQLNHLGKILQSRQILLNWLDIRDPQERRA